MSIQEQLAQQISKNPVVLYMKGSADAPQCGFSAQVVHILKSYNVQVLAVNVLEDPKIREGIKVFSQWPTIPQLYIAGEFIGGCDIVTSMHGQNQLQALLDKANAKTEL